MDADVAERVLVAGAPDLYAIASSGDGRAWLSLWCRGQRCPAPEIHAQLHIRHGRLSCKIEADPDPQWLGSACADWMSAEIGVANRPGAEPVCRIPLYFRVRPILADGDVIVAPLSVGATVG